MSALAIHVDALIKGHSYAPILDRWAMEVVDEAGGFQTNYAGTTLGLLRTRLERYAPAYDALILVGSEETRSRTYFAQRIGHMVAFPECMSVIVLDDWDSGAAVRGLQDLLRKAQYGSGEHIDLVMDGDEHFIDAVRTDCLVHIEQSVSVHRADPVLGFIEAVIPAPVPQPF